MTQDAPRPTRIKAPHGASVFEISWTDGRHDTIPHTVLRGFCPCASCQGHSGPVRFVAGQNLELREIQRVGNYALGLVWGDAHSGGIYSFTYLRKLGSLCERPGAEALIESGELP